ncbi:MAG: hypothetical protein ACD_15C00045G0020 [uncultured bacterium]|nr:MAG: hypothetical protein ACD_15C00045G0020 [uncultured bacterium]HCU70215.1 hypothetical protein [Candidatus Moranbacteria bacterium]
MLDKKLREVMELLGGKAVIKEGDQFFVVMNLREFKKIKQESLEGLTKQDLIDKINNNIATWKFIQEQKQTESIELEELGDIPDQEIVYEKA